LDNHIQEINKGELMKTVFTNAVLAVSITMILSAVNVSAAETPAAPAAAPTSAATPTPAQNGMPMMQNKMGMGDKSGMMGMMHDCMQNHKDGKMCDKQVMESCQKNMAKADCQKMMKEVKAEKTTTK
jgi:hypothetical protein